MRVEATIDGQILMLEVPAGGGIDKGGIAKRSEPDEVLQNVTICVRTVAAQLGRALELDSFLPPVAMEIQFGVRVDDKATVSVGLTPGEAQFLVTLKYDA